MMQSLVFPQYSEFLLAVLLATIVFVSRGHSQILLLLAKGAQDVILLLPVKFVNRLALMQIRAGWRTNTAFGYLCLWKIALALLLLLILSVSVPTLSVFGAAAAFFVPDLFLFVRMKQRQRQIIESLPQAMDLMVLCVDAGLGLDATIQRIADERTIIANVLNEELVLLGKDILLGMERERAYAEMFNRTGVEELRILGSALNQSSKLGLSIARVIRVQSEFLRLRQRQKAEEKAGKLPVLMAFPLWFFIMPSLMTILIAPSFILLSEQMGALK